MTEKQSQTLKVAYFIVGIAVPLAAYIIWQKTCGFGSVGKRRERVDRAHDITVEDSFPASDPPSAW